MKSLITVLLVAAFFSSHAQTRMTLQDCLNYAYQNNPGLQSSRSAIQQAEARVGEYLATGFPQINFNADLGDNYKIPVTFVPAAIFDPTAPEGTLVPVQFGTKYTGRAIADVNQMVFSGSYFVGLKAAKTYTELSKRELVKTETDLVEAIKKAYYSVLVNRERHDLVIKNYQRLDSLFRQTRIMYENGFAEKIDVNRVQVQFNNISQAVKNSSAGLEISMQLLKFQMGMPQEQEIILDDNLQTIQLSALNENFKEGFNYNNRIEFSTLEVNKALVELDIKNIKAQYLPSLDLYANYGATYGTSVFNNFVQFGENWVSFGAFGLRAKVPIFDGLQKSKIIQQKKLQFDRVEFNQQLVKNQIDLEQQQYSLQLQNNLDALKVQEENMKLAEEVYTIVVIKYKEGVGSNIEVIDADAAYKEAQVNYFTALYDALISTVDLEKAYGKLLIKSN
jgi:outer membrane protein